MPRSRRCCRTSRTSSGSRSRPPECSSPPIRRARSPARSPAATSPPGPGVRATVLLGLALMVGSSLAFAFADSIAVLDIARFVQGVGGAASWAGAMAWVAGAAPRERRGEMIGTTMGAAVAGALAGPAVGTLADAVGIAPTFCGIAVVGTLLAAWALRTPPAAPEGTSPPRELVAALRDGRVAGGIWLIAVPGLAVRHDRRARAAAAGRARRRARRRSAPRGSPPRCWSPAVSPIVGRMSDRRGRLFPCLIGLTFGAALMLLFPWPNAAWQLIVLVILAAPAVGMLWAPSMALLSDGAEALGIAQGFAFALSNLGWSIGQTAGAAGERAAGRRHVRRRAVPAAERASAAPRSPYSLARAARPTSVSPRPRRESMSITEHALRNLVAGDLVDAVDGGVREVVNPATGDVIAEVPEGSAGRRRPRGRRRQGGVPRLARHDARRARARDAQARRPARGARRGAVRARVRERRQADDGRARGDAGHGRQRALLRRRRAHARGPRGRRVHGRLHEHGAARADRRRRPDRAVELPADDGDLEDRAGARDRQHDRAQAVRADAADRAAARRARRGGAPARRAERDHGRRRAGRRRPRAPPRRAARLADRLGRDRQVDRAHGRRHAQARAPRARRQGADGRARRRRPGRGRRGAEGRRLLQLGPGLHGGDAHPRRARHPRRAAGGDRAGGRVDHGRRPGRGRRPRHGPGRLGRAAGARARLPRAREGRRRAGADRRRHAARARRVRRADGA